MSEKSEEMPEVTFVLRQDDMKLMGFHIRMGPFAIFLPIEQAKCMCYQIVGLIVLMSHQQEELEWVDGLLDGVRDKLDKIKSQESSTPSNERN